MSLFLYVLTDIIHMLTILLLCEMVFRFDKSKNVYKVWMWLVVVLATLGVSIGIYLGDHPIIEALAYTIIVCFALCLIYKGKVMSIVLSALWIIAVMTMLDTMSIVLFQILSRIFGYYNDNVSRLCSAIILYVMIFAFCRLFNKKYKQGIKTLGVGGLFSFMLLTAVNTFIVMVIALITLIEERVTDQVIYFIAFSLVILGIFLQLGAVILILMQRNIYKETQQLATRYLEDQKNHYEYLEKREIETKKFRHDIRSHMDMLASLAREHRYDDFDEYVEKINMKVDKLGNKVTVQNTMVDAIINRFYSESKKHNVKMSVDGVFPIDCNIHIYDLCTIFSNLLSNALEAAVDSKDKWISVRCRYTDKVIVVEIMNSFDSKVRAGNGRFKTRKEDKNNHGFGLINVEESIEKYNGVWYIDQENNVYKVTISFIYARMEGKNEISNN